MRIMQEKKLHNANLILERLSEVLEVRTDKALSEVLNVKPNTISSWKSRNSIDYPLVIALCEERGINLNWLFAGKEDLHILHDSAQAPYGQLPSKGIPYYNVDASASNIEIYTDEPMMATEYLNVPTFSDCDFAINVYGKSMEPDLGNGDIILCKRLTDLDVLPLGETYLIVTNEHRMVKILRKGSEKDRFLLISRNPEHEPFEIHKSKIIQIYLVKGTIKKKAI